VGALNVMRTKKPLPEAPLTPMDASLEATIVSLPVELLTGEEATASTEAVPGEPMPAPVSMKPAVAVRAVCLLPEIELRVYWPETIPSGVVVMVSPGMFWT
jgi:hypothetical protein